MKELIESLERKLSDAEQIKASSIAIRTFQVEQILTALKQKEWIRVELSNFQQSLKEKPSGVQLIDIESLIKTLDYILTPPTES